MEDRASGEDFRVVTGVLLGREHEGTGGIPERHDLSAAFAGRGGPGTRPDGGARERTGRQMRSAARPYE